MRSIEQQKKKKKKATNYKGWKSTSAFRCTSLENSIFEHVV